MTVSGSNDESHWRKWLSAVLVTALVAAPVLLLAFPMEMKVGTTVIRTRPGLLKPFDEFYEVGSGFVHGMWDGPTGDFTHGDTCGIKIGRWLFRLDIDRVWPHQVQRSGALDP